MLRDVDPDFLHHLYRERVHVAGGLRAGAGHPQLVSGGSTENSLRQVAATRIASAENEDKWRLGRAHGLGSGLWFAGAAATWIANTAAGGNGEDGSQGRCHEVNPEMLEMPAHEGG